jgi:hypothetical protein
MKTKPILCPERLRHVPRQFSWIDQRLVRDRHITRCRCEALALYLLLVTVADAQGTSYYSDTVAAGLLSLSVRELREARAQLIATGLVAYQAPFYQVLSLDPVPGAPLPPTSPRTSEALPIAEILRRMTSQP